MGRVTTTGQQNGNAYGTNEWRGRTTNVKYHEHHEESPRKNTLPTQPIITNEKIRDIERPINRNQNRT